MSNETLNIFKLKFKTNLMFILVSTIFQSPGQWAPIIENNTVCMDSIQDAAIARSRH